MINLNIGDTIAKDFWTQCAVEVVDIGSKHFFGVLFDYKENRSIGNWIGRLDDNEWRKINVRCNVSIVAGVN